MEKTKQISKVNEFQEEAETEEYGIRIVTERLSLEPLGMKYLQSVHEYASDIENTRYMLYFPNETIEETIEFLTDIDQQWKKENPDFYEFAILRNEVHIGGVCLYLDEDRKIGELGWILHKKYWKQGYVREAATALMEYAVSNLGIRHFIAYCDSANTGSYKVMESIGMKLAERRQGRKNKSSEEMREELKYEIVIPEAI